MKKRKHVCYLGSKNEAELFSKPDRKYPELAEAFSIEIEIGEWFFRIEDQLKMIELILDNLIYPTEFDRRVREFRKVINECVRRRKEK